MILNKEYLQGLVVTPSPSGHEERAIGVFDNYCGQFAKHEFTDAIGNSCYSVGEGEQKIMLSGHIDEIGFKIQYIDDNGFLYFIKDGGIDPKTIIGSNITVLTKKGNINGVIGKMPIHVEWRGKDKDNVTPISKMKIDCGFESKAEAMEYVSIGDAAVVTKTPVELGVNRFASGGIDDKVGVFITSEILRVLSNVKLKHTKVFGVACVQEEVGASGAYLASKRINPDYSMDYDVTFATDDDYVDKKEWGDISLGKGGALAYGPDSNHSFTSLIQEICEKNKIPFQAFAVGSGGTDTLPIKRGASNAITALISIPNRNMHTNVEMIDWRDIQSIIDMSVATIIKLDDEYEKKMIVK